MLRSMTGFGKASKEFGQYAISVEIKGLNSKNLELNVHLPKKYSSKEMQLRKLFSSELQRGKINVFIRISTASGGSQAPEINLANAKHYVSQFEKLSSETGIDISVFHDKLLRLPEVLVNVDQEDPSEWNIVQDVVNEAIKEFNEFRSVEGAAILEDLNSNKKVISTRLVQVESLLEERLEAVKERLSKGLKELEVDPDPSRYQQELIYYIEKQDLNEEIKRLEQHCKYFEESLGDEKAAGKKLGFIGQEMGREINTLGSKANHAVIQRLVVDMKEALEKIKEQVLNVL